MFIHSLEVKNYRSLEYIKLDNLQRFNVLIGRNNAGKSSVFQVLYDLNTLYAYSNAIISTDNLTDRDIKRALEITLIFKPNQQEREEIVGILIAAGFDPQRRTNVLEGPFLRRIRFSFKSVAGNPSLMHLRETSILAEDGKWTIVQKMTGDEQTANPQQNYVLISTVSKDAAQNCLEARLFDSTQHQTRINVHYRSIFSESWASDPAIRWLYMQLGKYLSEAFFFNPFRHSTSLMDVMQTTELAQDGANLAQVLHTLKTSEEETFDEIEHFIQGALPDIGRLRTPLINNKTRVVFRHSEQSYSIPLTDMGGGVEQLLMIATVLMMPKTQNSTLFLEEPESHLHAGAQRYLKERLYDSGRQVFISTHSPTFINLLNPHNLYQVINTNGRTDIRRSDAGSLDPVLEDIGVRNSDVLLSDAVLFVEGPGDRDVLTLFSEKLNMSFDEYNINVIPMGGGRHAERGAPIRSDLLRDISGKAPVPHMFVLDRDERRKEEIRSLEARLGDKVYVFQARELENYLLIPRAILAALKSKHHNNEQMLNQLESISEEQIDQLMYTAANNLYSTVLLKRIRNEIGGLRDGLLPTDAVTDLRSLTDSPELAKLILHEVRTQFDQYLAGVNIDRIVAAEKEELDRAWSNPENRLQLAPGEEILTEVYRTFGSEYNKPEDTRSIARELQVDEIHREIAEVIKKVKDLSA